MVEGKTQTDTCLHPSLVLCVLGALFLLNSKRTPIY